MASLDPDDWPRFRKQAHRMLDDALDYIEHIRERPVWQATPAEVRERMRHEAVPHAPTDISAIHHRFLNDILPYAAGNTHPGFMGWVHGGGTPVGVLAEMLAASLNANLGGRDHVPIEVERQIVSWMRSLFGFPDTATGLFVTGTSMANLIAVLVARDAVLGFAVRGSGVAADSRRLTAYASPGVHMCMARALDICGIGSAALRLVSGTAAMAEAIDADRRAGFTPFLVAGTAGSADTGAIDDLAGLAGLAHREHLWFHVDGAFGALAILAPDLAPLLRGIERADSVAFDFHKWGQVPYDAGFVLVRDGELHRRTFATSASYLRREESGLGGGSPWPCDFGPDLSRGFRALKTWFTLLVYGTDALGAAISHTCALARYLRKRIEETPELELMAPVPLNIVCFGYRGATPEVNARIAVELQKAGAVAPSTTAIDGRIAIRAAIVNHRTSEAEIDQLVEGVLAAGRAANFRHACELAQSGRTDQARETFLEVLRREPSHRLALNYFGALLEQTGYRTAARTAFAEAVARHPDDPMSQTNLANSYRESGDLANARAHYEFALDIAPRLAEAHQGLSLVLADLGEAAAADRHRRLGFGGKPALTAPYRGEGTPVRVLVLAGTSGGNVPVRNFLDDRTFETTIVFVEFLDPAAPLPPHNIVFNAIGDPEKEGDALAALPRILSRITAPVINPPSAVLASGRGDTAERLARIPGVVTSGAVTLPRAMLNCPDAVTTLARLGFEFPLLLRTPGFHMGRHFLKLETPDDLAGALHELPGNELTVLRWLDARGPDGKFRKYRAMMIDGRIYPLHAAISSHWKIHYFSAEMADNAAHRAEDAAFLNRMEGVLGPRAMAALRAIQFELGLDYAGIDFGLSPRGEILLFEANATMVVNPPEAGEKWTYRRPAVERIYTAVRNMLLERSGLTRG